MENSTPAGRPEDEGTPFSTDTPEEAQAYLDSLKRKKNSTPAGPPESYYDDHPMWRCERCSYCGEPAEGHLPCPRKFDAARIEERFNRVAGWQDLDCPLGGDRMILTNIQPIDFTPEEEREEAEEVAAFYANQKHSFAAVKRYGELRKERARWQRIIDARKPRKSLLRALVAKARGLFGWRP